MTGVAFRCRVMAILVAVLASLSANVAAVEPVATGPGNGENAAQDPRIVAVGLKTNAAATADDEVARVPWQPALDPDPTLPRIILSEMHQQTCLKKMGDMIGDVELIDINNQKQKLSDMLSDRLTVLVLWDDKSIVGMEQFQRIPVEVLGTFAKYRVKVVAVNVGGDVDTTRRLTGDAADKIVSLVDGDSKFFKSLATSRVPRTYLLDKEGRILWFDIEYSQGMLREMSNALAWYIKNM